MNDPDNFLARPYPLLTFCPFLSLPQSHTDIFQVYLSNKLALKFLTCACGRESSSQTTQGETICSIDVCTTTLHTPHPSLEERVIQVCTTFSGLGDSVRKERKGKPEDFYVFPACRESCSLPKPHCCLPSYNLWMPFSFLSIDLIPK